MRDPSLYWLPETKDWRPTIAAIRSELDDAHCWRALVAAARMRLNFVQTHQLDRLANARFGMAPPQVANAKAIRIAMRLRRSTI